MKTPYSLLGATLLTLMLWGCKSELPNSLAFALGTPAPTSEQLAKVKGQKDVLLTIETPMGEMKAVLHDQTPGHKENFLKLVREGFYDSLLFHRVIDAFMIQGGDPDSRRATAAQSLGNGGPGYTLPAEFVDGLFHQKGAIAAARMGDNVNPKKESSGSQFYIVQGKKFSVAELEEMRMDMRSLYSDFLALLEQEEYAELKTEYVYLQQNRDSEGLQELIMKYRPTLEKANGKSYAKTLTEAQKKAYTTIGGTPHLDEGYTVFGQVIHGLDVLDKIAAVSTGKADRPQEDIWMRISLEETTKKKIARKFGYIYPEMY